MPRPLAWAFIGGGAYLYSHTAQAADLHICVLAATQNRRSGAESTTTAPWSLRERISDDMIRAMEWAYRAEATARDLAHDLSLSSVKRLLRIAGVRRTPPTRQGRCRCCSSPSPGCGRRSGARL
jgi:hypothetical protein